MPPIQRKPIKEKLKEKLERKKEQEEEDEDFDLSEEGSEVESNGSSIDVEDTETQRLKQLQEHLSKLKEDELRETLEKLVKDPVKKETIKKMKKTELIEEISKLAKREKQPFGKCWLFVILFIFLAVVGLRAMEDLYNPGMELMESYFEVIGVPTDASDADIRRAYRKLALKYHPDKRDPNCVDCEEKMHQLTDAYEVLTTEKYISNYREYAKNKLAAAEKRRQEIQDYLKSGGKEKENAQRKRSD
eukprot:c30676_g1_i1.p1 GENE.c30676_g1_i1~~c30676_g1_i1.p1  ORF type:complete len:260 (+),score=118.16 c30676_g1_i1:44-781(+)